MSTYDNLTGLPYFPGKQDCFSICRQYFAAAYGLFIRNYARPERFWEDRQLDLYKMYKLEGFRPVTDDTFEIGDVLLMPLMTPFATHACIVVADNLILHHPPGQLSVTDRLNPRWGSRATIVVRHPEVTRLNKERLAPETIHLHEIIDADVFRHPDFKAAAKRVLAPDA